VTDPTVLAERWAREAVPSLESYIRIPNQSPAYDPDWSTNGLIDEAVEHIASWCRLHGPPDLAVEVLRLADVTPVLWMELPGAGAAADRTVLLYGHADKQPPMAGWSDGLGPYDPVVRDGKLYGRGGADDGYSAYGSVLALRSLVEAGPDRPRCVVLIEASEESGSPHLPTWLDHLSDPAHDRIGTPDLVICLDSGCGNYHQLWVTTSLRGLVIGELSATVLREGVHSGDAGGIVPDSFRELRRLLARIEDAETGRVLLPAAAVAIPDERRQQAEVAASALGSELIGRFPWIGDPPSVVDLAEAILDRTWRAALGVHGQSGLPDLAQAGNVLRSHTAVRLSIRLPPTSDAMEVQRQLEDAFRDDVTPGVTVSFDSDFVATGWSAPPIDDRLATALEEASQLHFGRPVCFMGEGGTIPFMAMLGQRFPGAQFLITGVLGPGANAHGPNEFLHLDYTRRLVACVADVLISYGRA